jgi:hypothetical protein
MESIGVADEVIHEHNYSFRAEDSRNAATSTAPPLSDQSNFVNVKLKYVGLAIRPIRQLLPVQVLFFQTSVL